MIFSGDDGLNLQNIAAAVAIIAAICSAIATIYRLIKKRRYHQSSYYASREIFSDREQNLAKLIHLSRSNIRLINVYGKRGIGKSAFLRYFCDYLNHTLSRKNKRRRINGENTRTLRGHAFYFHISGNGTCSINEQLLQQMPESFSSLTDAAEHLTHLIRWKSIFIVIDNVNNAGLSRELEEVVEVFLTYSVRYRVIVGSIEKQFFLNISENQVDYIELPLFNESDLFDFAAKNGKKVPREYLSQILNFSDGLPVFVSLLLNNTNRFSALSSVTFNIDRMNSYLSRIFEDLDDSLSAAAQYIGFISITTPIIKVRALKEMGVPITVMDLERLSNFSLIEYDKDNQAIKMHELFRDYICVRFSNSTNIITAIYEYYKKKGLLYEQTYYLILLDTGEDTSTIKCAVENAIREENFAFLLILGEQYKSVYGLSSNATWISEETFLIIILGYLEALIGVGNYPAAQDVIEKSKVPARAPRSDLQFRFSLLTAQLYHLQNSYEESIASYMILLKEAQTRAEYNKYEPRCLWGIAHSYRHQGNNYDTAIDYYDQSILAAEKLNRKSEIIKGMREKLIIYLLRGQAADAHELHLQLCIRMKKLPKDGYIETRISFLKTEINYISALKINNSELAYRLIEKVFSHYKEQNKRLQYNASFQFGEYYRHKGDYDSATINYNRSLRFSRKNLDHNLETMSIIGLSICEMCSGQQKTLELTNQLVQCIELCEEFDLHTNKLLAEMLLAIVNGLAVDESVISELKQIRYEDAVFASTLGDTASLNSLCLYLM